MATTLMRFRLEMAVELLLCVLLVGGASAMKLPHYFKPCFQNDPNMAACFKQHAIDALPHLITKEGDPQYGIPPLVPMRIPEMHFDNKGLLFSFHDVTITGLEHTQIMDYRVDMKRQHEEADTFNPRIEVFGEYKAKGSQMGMEIDGGGPFNITIINVKATGTHEYNLDVGITGKDHMSVKNMSFLVVPEEVYLRFEKLFPDPEMNNDVNQMLNENWREMLVDMGPSLSKPMIVMATEIYHGITDHVPFHDIYPLSPEALAAEKD